MLNDSFFLKYLNLLAINTPTEIQTQCFLPIYEKKSVFALAPTGSGKTLAFVLPLMLNVEVEKRYIQQLILVPTRELGVQIARVCQQVADVISASDKKNILVRTAFGGIPISKQIEEIAKNPHVLIATPGRVIDLFERKALNLQKISSLVLDEADIMVGMGFAEQIQTIYEQLPSSLQVALFSATKSEKVTDLEDVILNNKHYEVCTPKNIQSELSDKSYSDSEIKHQYIRCNYENKFEKLAFYLKDFDKKKDGKIILFCHMRETAQDLAILLKKEGFLADSLTGELGQVHRNSIMRNFKSGNLKYLVATNIASRGIDVEKLSAVIHYDVPFNQEDYIHRSGRTGRSGFNQGCSIVLHDPKTKNYYDKMMKELHISPEEINLLSSSSVKKNIIENRVNFIKVHINKGKQNKIRPGDIVGSFIQEFSLQKEDIGSIFIFNNFTHVEINIVKKNIILNKDCKVKNLAVKIVLAN